MAKASMAILDISSSKITALIGDKGVNNTFALKAVKTLKYSGYESSDFFDLEELNDTVNAAIKSIELSSNTAVKKVYISVPGEFVLVENGLKSISLAGGKTVKDRDVKRLMSAGIAIDGYEHIKTSPIYFNLSDKIRTVNPIGYKSSLLESFNSYFLAKKNFIDIFNSILNGLDIFKVVYVPSSLAQALYLIPYELRDEKAYLLNLGYLSCTLSAVYGNGITHQKSFSRGEGYAAAYLSQALEVDFELAELILSKTNLSVSHSRGDDLDIEYKDKQYKFKLNDIYEVIYFALDEICELINMALSSFDSDDIDGKPIYITGGGFYGVRGAYEYISKRLSIVIENIYPNQPHLNKPQQSSVLSLLSFALEEENKS